MHDCPGLTFTGADAAALLECPPADSKLHFRYRVCTLQTVCTDRCPAFLFATGVFCTSKELGEGAAETSQPQHRHRSVRQQGRPGQQESRRLPGQGKQTNCVFTGCFICFSSAPVIQQRPLCSCLMSLKYLHNRCVKNIY